MNQINHGNNTDSLRHRKRRGASLKQQNVPFAVQGHIHEPTFPPLYTYLFFSYVPECHHSQYVVLIIKLYLSISYTAMIT